MSVSSVTKKPFLLVTGGIYSIFWLVAFGGACAWKPENVTWWVIVYNLLLVVATFSVLVKDAFVQNRLAILTLLAISIPLTTVAADSAIQTTKLGPGNQDGARACAGGLIVIVMVELLWVVGFGSDHTVIQDNLLDTNDNTRLSPASASRQPQSSGEKHEADSDMIINMSSEPIVIHNHEGSSSPRNLPLEVPTTPPAQAVVHAERIRARYAYKGSADDQDELSFEKDEVLEVVSRNGNWWKACKADGTEGKVPSNYFEAI